MSWQLETVQSDCPTYRQAQFVQRDSDVEEGMGVAWHRPEMTLTKGGNKIVFDIQIPTPKGVLFAMYMKRHQNYEVVGNALQDGGGVKMAFNKAQDKLGHMSNVLTKLTTKQLRWQLTGAA